MLGDLTIVSRQSDKTYRRTFESDNVYRECDTCPHCLNDSLTFYAKSSETHSRYLCNYHHCGKHVFLPHPDPDVVGSKGRARGQEIDSLISYSPGEQQVLDQVEKVF